MSTTAKVIVGFVAAFALLIVLTFFAGRYWWSHHKEGLKAEIKVAYEKASEFGRDTNNEGCQQEALRRHRKQRGIRDSIENAVFFRFCLGSSQETPGFCDGVPNETAYMQSIKWQLAQCAAHELKDPQCANLFASVQRYCSRRRS